MFASANWINDYLDPPAPFEEQIDLLTRAGFPVEHFETVDTESGQDVRLDVETTSNRGDCLCHLGLAREIAAMSASQRRVTTPEIKLVHGSTRAADQIRVTNKDHARCPRYTARIIRGVRVGPSPQWLRDRLIARGDLPRNNIVDATNFVLFEYGQPSHVFDLSKLLGAEIRIRAAHPGEQFLPLGEGARELKLHENDLVIADAERAVALAGVKGGALTAVTNETTDILIEAATFAAGAVRASSRRHGIASDSSYRFERGVHPGAIDEAADRLAALILELAGGELADASAEDGDPLPAPRDLALRPRRTIDLLGIPVEDAFMLRALDRLGLMPRVEGSGDERRIHVSVPPQRIDLEREIDLVEEIGRLHGYEHVPVHNRIEIPVQPPQPTEMARRAVSGELAGLGFTEAVTHTLVSHRAAEIFRPADLQLLSIEDDRAKADPILRPSLIPSLLRVVRTNLDQGAGAMRLFESASIFARRGNDTLEEAVVTLLVTDRDTDHALRTLRGVIDRLVQLLRGTHDEVRVAENDNVSWFQPGATIHLADRPLGTLGLLTDAALKACDVPAPVAAAELSLPALYGTFPPDIRVTALPAFPAIERDITAVFPESVRWAQIHALITGLRLPALEAAEFVTTFRGKSVGPGKKSLSLRLRFRAPDRTLTHDEVDGVIDPVFAELERTLGGTIRREVSA